MSLERKKEEEKISLESKLDRRACTRRVAHDGAVERGVSLFRPRLRRAFPLLHQKLKHLLLPVERGLVQRHLTLVVGNRRQMEGFVQQCVRHLPVAYGGGHMQRRVAVAVDSLELVVGQLLDDFKRDLGFLDGDDDAEQGVVHEVEGAGRVVVVLGQPHELLRLLAEDQLVNLSVVALVEGFRRIKLPRLVVIATVAEFLPKQIFGYVRLLLFVGEERRWDAW